MINIYKIMLHDEVIYVGQTSYSIQKRWSEHKSFTKSGNNFGIKNAGSFLIIWPSGKNEIISNLRSFCKQNNLNYNSMRKVSCGLRNSCNNFTIKRVD